MKTSLVISLIGLRSKLDHLFGNDSHISICLLPNKCRSSLKRDDGVQQLLTKVAQPLFGELIPYLYLLASQQVLLISE